MNKRRRLGLIVVLGVAITAAAFFAPRPREPVCQGKRLSVWLRELDNASLTVDSHNRAVEAVRQIGSNGVPILIEMLHSSDSWLKRKLIELAGKQSWIRFHFTTAKERRCRAFRAIEVLGPAAHAAIPTLMELLNDNDLETWPKAMICLAGIGPEAMLPLIQAMTNATPQVRGRAIIGLGMLSCNAQAAVPALVQRLESDRDDRVRACAANALGLIRKEPQVVVPNLIKNLRDANPTIRAQVALALGMYGAEAKAACSVLVELDRDEDQFVRDAAAKALKEIDSETAVEAGVQ